MTAFVGLSIVFIAGIALLFLIYPQLPILLKIGLGFPAGFGLLASFVFLFDFIGISYNYTSSILCLLMTGVILVVIRRNEWLMYFRKDYKEDFMSIRLKPVHLGWLLFFACLAYVVYAITLKTLYWPTTSYDSITGYDYIAKVIATEGKLDNSINNPINYTFTLRTLYPPLVPIAFAFAYICGLATSKIVSSIFFFSVIISFYGFIRHYSTHFNAIVFTLLLAVIPEFLAMSALSLSNVPSMAYTTAGVAFLIMFFSDKKQGLIWLSAIMMGFAIFTRTEGIVFAAASGIVLLFYAVPKKNWLSIVLYAAIPLFFFVLWELYVKYVWELSDFKQPFLYKLFYDADRLSLLWDKVTEVTFNTQLYGVTVFVFLISLFLSIRPIYLQEQRWELLGIIILSWLLYIWVYYQMDIFEDNKLMAGGGGYIASGYKRGMFNFLALALLFSAITLPVRNFFKKWLG